MRHARITSEVVELSHRVDIGQTQLMRGLGASLIVIDAILRDIRVELGAELPRETYRL